MNEIYYIALCEECAKSTLGFVIVIQTVGSDKKKCEFCGKPRPLNIYRVMKEETNG